MYRTRNLSHVEATVRLCLFLVRVYLVFKSKGFINRLTLQYSWQGWVLINVADVAWIYNC